MAKPRIISGSAKGVILNSLAGKSTRPITDRVKEALFNIIGADIRESAFLDLFAGTGSVGLEALSRGAVYVKFIEKNLKVIDILNANLKKCRLEEKGDILAGDAFSLIKSNQNASFDYVYIAPPQYHDLWADMLQNIDENIQNLNENAWIIAQIDPIELKELEFINLTLFDQRKYGNTLLLFYIFNQPL